MTEARSDTVVMQAESIEGFFHQSLTQVCERRGTDVSESSVAYIVNLLSRFLHADQFFEWQTESGMGLRPLALMYGDAVHSQDRQQRISVLRRMGDVALFVAGLFGPSLSRKLAGMNYYIDMGGGAYGMLCSDLEARNGDAMDPGVFRELSERFSDFVGMLDEFAQDSSLRTDRDLINLYEHWLRNNDAASASRLAASGVAVSNIQSTRHH